MALASFKFLPGIDKQDTPSGAENRWWILIIQDLDINFLKKLEDGHRF